MDKYQPQTDFTDLNANGKSEITLRYTLGSTSQTCTQYIDVYEWTGMQFTNLAGSMAPLASDKRLADCKGYQFSVIANGGPQEIIAELQAGPVTYQKIFNWNGSIFQWARDLTLTSPTPTTRAEMVKWALAAGPDNDEALAILERLVVNWLPAYDTAYGPGGYDYFRFTLGSWYALRGAER